RELRRVLRSDGTLWLEIGDTYSTHPAGLSGEARWKASTLGGRDLTGHEQAGQLDKRNPEVKEKELCMIPARVALALSEDGWYLRAESIWHRPNPMPESVRDRPTRAHTTVYLLTKRPDYFYDPDAVREPQSGGAHFPRKPQRPEARSGGLQHPFEAEFPRLHARPPAGNGS
ncbi:DNA (cytosine-5-)-methyltransferase, partial [mine drainage metagenome]